MYASFDDGKSWQSLQLNLPVTPVTDLQIKEGDLVLSTQGRSFWILDDLTTLHQLSDESVKAAHHLYQPRDVFRTRGGGFDIPSGSLGQNPPSGVVIHYSLSEALPEDQEMKLEILDSSGATVRRFSSKTPEERARSPFADLFAAFFGGGAPRTPPVKKGANRWVWDLGYPDGRPAPDTIMWGSVQGPPAPPGRYSVKMTIGDWSETREFEVKKDPRISATQADLDEQFQLAVKVRDLFSESHDSLKTIRSVKSQVTDLTARLKEAKADEGVGDAAKALTEKLTGIEEKIYQTKNESMQDPLNFQPMLDNRIANLYGIVLSTDAKPTAVAHEHYQQLKSELEGYQRELESVLASELSAFNQTVSGKNLSPILVPRTGVAGTGENQ
jgi:hypothetical protein